jgi:hypothetical protein
MSQHLITNLDNLYKLFSYKDLDIYYDYNFLPEYNSIDVKTIYDIFNTLSITKLNKFHLYLFRQWNLIKEHHEYKEQTPLFRKQEIMNRVITHIPLNSCEEFNTTYSNFIQGDKVLGLYFINKFLLYFYPCRYI